MPKRTGIGPAAGRLFRAARVGQGPPCSVEPANTASGDAGWPGAPAPGSTV